MRKLVILTLLLAAGLTAYPQSSSRSRESKSRSSSSINKSSRSSAAKTKSTASRSSRSAQKKSGTVSRSSGSSRSAAVQSKANVSSRSKAVKSRSSSASRGNAVQSRSANDSRNRAARSSIQSNSRSRSTDSRETSIKRSASRIGSSATREKGTSGSSFNRSNRQVSKVYVRTDGREFKHQNEAVFATRKYKVDFRNGDELRRSNDFRRVYRDYDHWYNNRYRRNHVVQHYHYNAPLSLEIRRVRYPYRRPVNINICWTPDLHHRFMYYYPTHSRWNTSYGSYVETVSSYEAMNFVGSVKRVYGKVEEVYYSSDDNTYTLYFGAEFPYHDFSVVIPRNLAKNIAWSPSWHFQNEFVWVVGLIDVWEGKPEIIIRDEDQIRRY